MKNGIGIQKEIENERGNGSANVNESENGNVKESGVSEQTMTVTANEKDGYGK